MAVGGGQRGAERLTAVLIPQSISTDPLYFSNPLVSGEPQVDFVCIVAVFEYKSVEHFIGIS